MLKATQAKVKIDVRGTKESRQWQRADEEREPSEIPSLKQRELTSNAGEGAKEKGQIARLLHSEYQGVRRNTHCKPQHTSASAIQTEHQKNVDSSSCVFSFFYIFFPLLLKSRRVGLSSEACGVTWVTSVRTTEVHVGSSDAFSYRSLLALNAFDVTNALRKKVKKEK